MQEARIAGCKINLGLRITGIRDDGYHTLDSLFWPLSAPHDVLEFEALDEHEPKELLVMCDVAGIDCLDNTLTKAYAAFVALGGRVCGGRVRLTKGIPHGAGLGGGSSDAAQVLLWCNAHARIKLSAENLHKAALRVGADVPFFLYAQPARVQGIGEIIMPCTDNERAKYAGLHAVLICPDVYISTPWAYKTFDAEKNKIFLHQSLTKMPHKDKHELACTARPQEGSKTRLTINLENDFEAVIFAKHPVLQKLKQDLLDCGATMALMSGSGSSIFGLFRTKKSAEVAIKYLTNTSYKVFTATL